MERKVVLESGGTCAFLSPAGGAGMVVLGLGATTFSFFFFPPELKIIINMRELIHRFWGKAEGTVGFSL